MCDVHQPSLLLKVDSLLGLDCFQACPDRLSRELQAMLALELLPDFAHSPVRHRPHMDWTLAKFRSQFTRALTFAINAGDHALVNFGALRRCFTHAADNLFQKEHILNGEG